MRTFLNILGILLLLVGGTFFLQGINFLPGSYMTGDLKWGLIGGMLIVLAIGLIFSANRRN